MAEDAGKGGLDAARAGLETEWKDKCLQCPLLEARLCGSFKNKADPDSQEADVLAAKITAAREARGLIVREPTEAENLVLGGGNATG